MKTSAPHEKRLKELKEKERLGTINAGEKIEMKDIERYLTSLQTDNPLNQADVEDGKAKAREKEKLTKAEKSEAKK